MRHQTFTNRINRLRASSVNERVFFRRRVCKKLTRRRVSLQIIDRQVRVSIQHRQRFPPTESLQRQHGRSRLCHPTCPRMTTIVKSKRRRQTRIHQRLHKNATIDVVRAFVTRCEHVPRVFSDTTTYHVDRARIQRHGSTLPAFSLCA